MTIDLPLLRRAGTILSKEACDLMTCDYEAIRRENIKRYGTDIGRIGPMLLVNRYHERMHFIFELLQNAEGALGRLSKPPKSRAVSFNLKDTSLRISHYDERSWKRENNDK